MKNKKNLLIVGAGEAAGLLLKEIEKNPSLKYEIKGFVDDFKEGSFQNLPIWGKINEISKIVKEIGIEEIIVAIPSLKKERLKEILNLCEESGLETKIVPGTYESLKTLKTGLPLYSEVREVNIEDLLRRKPELIDFGEIEKYLFNKSVLVTGGGGSIGSELCRQIAELKPSFLYVLDNCEFFLYEITNKLKENYPELKFRPIIADIRDRKKLEEIFSQNKIDVVFHTAAYKHVPMMEFNIKEAVKNNVFGSYNVLDISAKYNVKNIVVISTDKVVNPTNIMGVTKRIVEKITQLFYGNGSDILIVRFGNVLGSRGSAIPLFESQIKKGGPITITDSEMTRYFMTIPEAAQLVIQAGVIGKGKEIMVLDMGEPYKIQEIAEELVRLHGLEPHKDIKFNYTGLRPGEKLHEELFTEFEGATQTKHKRIFVVQSEEIDKKEFGKKIEELSNIIQSGLSDKEVVSKLKEMVPSYVEDQTKEKLNW